jgi:crotonobetainyl-CoA:carnitine CoA-transferase CaiB-like acyl-CoA transferase
MSSNTHGDLPLEGIRILELGMVFVLPLAITPLAGMGADVIKIESEIRPEQSRWGPQPNNEMHEPAYNYGGSFHMLNRNKRGVTIDLAKPKGRELFLRLVAVSDVVAENFTPRVLRNLDLTYDRLAEVNPRIILLSSSGFGQTGPWQNYRAYGPVTESVDGLMMLTGYEDGPPQRGGSGGLGVTFPDVAGAYYGSYAILGALEQREHTGRGQWLDLSHFEAGVATIPEAILDYTMNGRVQERMANRHPWRAPQGVYPCLGADRWLALSIATDAQFAALSRVLGLPGLAGDQRFVTLDARRRNQDALDAIIGSATGGWVALDLEKKLQAAGIDAAAVADSRDVWLDPQLAARGFFEMMPAPNAVPEVGSRPFIRPGWKMSESEATTRRQAPDFGEHTREVLGEYLEMRDAELDALMDELAAEGVIADRPRQGMVARDPTDLAGMLETGLLQEVDPEYRQRLASHLQGGVGLQGVGSKMEVELR